MEGTAGEGCALTAGEDSGPSGVPHQSAELPKLAC
jgi:hypothetical protein